MLVLVSLVLGGCFSTPRLDRAQDGGPSDGGGGDDGSDAACVPAVDPPPPSFTQLQLAQVSAGPSHVCAIDVAGALWCWGENDEGELGQRTDSPGEVTGRPGLASPLPNWTAVSASTNHTCGIANKKVYCWGRNMERQSDPTMASAFVAPTEVALSLPVSESPVKIFAGPTMSCAITDQGRALCWGDLDLELGTVTSTPTTLGGTTTWSTMAIGDNHACAIASTDGTLYCWGQNTFQQLGVTGSVSRTFVQVAQRTADMFTSVAVSDNATCATRDTGALVCFGSSGLGHLGNVSFTTSAEREVATGIAHVAMGYDHVCVTTSSNDVKCYGDNTDGAMGIGQFVRSRTLTGTVLSNATEIVAGRGFTCALDSTNRLSCWGADSHGELGLGILATKRDPVPSLLPVGTCESVIQLVAGDRHTCAIVGTNGELAGRLYCWGDNTRRQIQAMSSEPWIRRPIEAIPGERFTRVALGEMHTCALRDDGVIRCWGDNSESQLGQSGLGPTQILPPMAGMPWQYVAAGSRASCAISLTGELFCWGNVPGTAQGSIPTNFGRSGTNFWQSISLGSGFAVGTVFDPNDGTRAYVRAFGDTGCQLNGATTPVAPNAAVPIGSSNHIRVNVSAAQAGGGHACVHSQDADMMTRLVCFGENNSFQVSDESDTSCLPLRGVVAPTVSGWRVVLTGIMGVTTSRAHSCALEAGGRPVCWGENSNYELGRVRNGMHPTVLTEQRFAELATGATHTCGITEDRHGVSCWGLNREGQIGDDTAFYPAPVPSGRLP